MDKQPNTDNLSIYDLPTLNAVIDKYEDPKFKNNNPTSAVKAPKTLGVTWQEPPPDKEPPSD